MNEKQEAAERVLALIYEVVDQVNRGRASRDRIDKQPNTVLIGKNGQLDSLGMVNFIIGVEELIEDEYGVQISLVDGTSVNDSSGHLRTIENLNAHIVRTVAEIGKKT